MHEQIKVLCSKVGFKDKNIVLTDSKSGDLHSHASVINNRV